MRTKAIIFDYGNVLDVPDLGEDWLAHRDSMAVRFNLNGVGRGRHIYQSEAWQQVKRGYIDIPAFHDAVLRPLGITDAAEQKAFFASFFTGRDRIHAEMRALLDELKPRFRLAILSNTDIVDMDKWLELERGLDGMFELVVSSAQVHMAKPDKEIYLYTLEKLGLAADEVIFVDDLARNTEIAEKLGIPCITFESPAHCRAELVAHGVLEA